MKKKVIMLILFLVFLIMANFVSYVSANFTPTLPSDNIIIEADGRVRGTDKIIRNGDTYIFVGNVSGTKTIQGNSLGNMSCALAICRSNIIIDGAGFALQCDNLTGIDISNRVCKKPSEQEIWNVTIKNLRITNFTQGIRCEFGGNHTFHGNYISNDYVTQNGTDNFAWNNLGIALWGSTGNNINHCTIGGSPAIYMHFTCSNNIVTENNIVFGVHLAISGNETFDKNYWGDYSIKYPNATEIDSLGIWSVPYAFSDSQATKWSFQDNHALISPVSIPNFSTALPKVRSPEQELGLSSNLAAVVIVVAVLAIVSLLVLAYVNRRRSSRAAVVKNS